MNNVIDIEGRQSAEQWLDAEGYLPEFMKEFHDQQDLFRDIGERDIPEEFNAPSIMDSHIYTVDCFLHYMARRGWTLQESKEHLMFLPLTHKKKQNDSVELMKSFLKPDNES